MAYLRRKAKSRGLAFEVDAEYLWTLFLLQSRRCALSGVDLFISSKIDKNQNIDRSNHTASLDRIDNSIGYVRGNVQWVHKKINQMRRQYSIVEYVHWCSLVSSHANSEPSSANDKYVAEKVQRLTGEESTNNPDTSAPHPERVMI
jgi:hypothetical protein